MTFTINSDNSGRTILSFLKSKIKISTSSLAKLKRDKKGILINGKHVTVRYMLCDGDILTLNETDSAEDENPTLIPVDLPINIIFENDDILLADKPPYMPTHPSHGHVDDSLANGIAYIYKEKGLPFVFRPIGRLDRNTSGISLIAKHSISASFLSYARRQDMIHKKYIAILCGKIDSDGEYHIIDTYMKRQTESVIIRCIGSEDDPDAFRAITHWRLLYSNEQISVVEAIPETGRTHQLRVHFAHIGHPILGDDVYGRESPYIKRHALHAACLTLPLPYNETKQTFYSIPPDDMKEAFKALSGLELKDICHNIITQ